MSRHFSIEISLTLAAILLKSVIACSPGPDWVPSTTQDQAQDAPIVAQGTVTQTLPNVYPNKIVLGVSAFFKGCAPPSMTVNGFRSSAACGVDAPIVGSEVIVFVRPDANNTGEYTLNEINIHTGMLYVGGDVVSEVVEVTGPGVAPAECGGGEGTNSPTRNEVCPERPPLGNDSCDAAEDVTCRYRARCCDGKPTKKRCKCRGGLWRCADSCMTDCRCCAEESGSCADGGEEECCVDGSLSCPTASGESTCPDPSTFTADAESGVVECHPDPQCNTESFCFLTRQECCSRFEDGSTSGDGFTCLPCLEKKSAKK